MDRKTWIVVIALGLLLVAWQPLMRLVGLGQYLEPRSTPPPAAVLDTTGVATPSLGSGTPAAPAPGTPAPAPPVTGTAPAAPGTPPTATATERLVRIETPLYEATFSDRGARLVGFQLKRYTSAHGAAAVLGRSLAGSEREVPAADRVALTSDPSFAIDLGSGANKVPLAGLVYTVQESLDASGQVRGLVFTARDSSGLFVRQTWRVREKDYALDLEVELRDVPDAWRVSDYSLTTRSWPLFTESDLVSDHRALTATSLVGENLHREHSNGLLKGAKRFEGNAAWAGVQSRYFLNAVAVLDGVARGVESSAAARPLTSAERERWGARPPSQEEIAVNTLVVGLPAPSDPVDRFLVYLGPAEHDRLAEFGLQIERVVNLGWRWLLPFSHFMLEVLGWIHGVVRNYGLAIILLALLVRVVLHPLNAASMKSMRGLQKVQPEIERLKEKYKSDPQAMNAAMMALYKEHKVNPAGGCLPMLIQMPVFIALYNVLANSIELRQASFIAWISDLSAPDQLFSVAGFPIRVLPILMALTGLLQTKLTPTDPRQMPTMYLMNVVMLVFFYNLPSGLVLYWTVMNLLTALQSWMLLREDGGKAAPVPAPLPVKANRRG